MEGISIVLTYYNGSKYIKEQIESLCKQSIPFDELLIFDDCSTDDQFEYLKEYLKTRTENITLRKNNCNLGYAKNFLNGCKYASYNLIFLCDQDDLWDNNKLELMRDTMNGNPDINLLACDIEPFYCSENAPKWDTNNLKTMCDDGSVEKLQVSTSNSHIMRSGSAMCVRKSFFDDVITFWIEGWAHDDFLWKCALFTDSCALLHKKLLHRRIHDNNTSELKERTIEWRISELEEMKDQLIALKEYIKSKKKLKESYEEVIEHNICGLKKRIKMLKEKNPLIWFQLATRYKDTYPRVKGLYLDMYLLIFRIYKV